MSGLLDGQRLKRTTVLSIGSSAMR